MTVRAGERPGEAAALLEAFVEEVSGLAAAGVLPSCVGASLVGRVDQLLAAGA